MNELFTIGNDDHPSLLVESRNRRGSVRAAGGTVNYAPDIETAGA